ncbi:MAG: pectinesterase family protein [Bacteroidales bacterium]|nr:pectinesterase family protein [Bacteroidales bacterium]
MKTLLKKLVSAALLMMPVFSAVAQPNAPDIVVDKKGNGQFTTLQEAILSVRDYKPTRVVIYVKDGVYNEKVIVPSNKCDITIIGQSVEHTRIVYSDHAKLNNMGTFKTSTMRIDGDGIRLENLTVENNAGRVGQAVALHVEGDKCEFVGCKFIGNQDTVFNGRAGAREFFCNCYIEGTTDFIFGPATVWFEKCELFCKSDSYITAASTPQDEPFGYVFNKCEIKVDRPVKAVYLGRPWRAYAAVVFMNCKFPAQIRPEGWHDWGQASNRKSSRYCEYNNEGSDVSNRVDWSKQLTDDEAKAITMEAVMTKTSGWSPEYYTLK